MLYVFKVILLFTSAIAALRLMGKSTLAQVTPHDLMAIVIIAALATNPIRVDDYGKAMLAIVLVAGVHILFAKLTLYKWTNRFILGEPTILVKHGKIVKENLRRCEISLSELLADIRTHGYPDMRYIQYAILEPTGAVSVLPREEFYPVTPAHLGLKVDYEGISLSLVVDGRIQFRNLRLIGKDRQWLEQEIRRQGFRDVSRILYAAVNDREADLYIDDGRGHRSPQ